METEVIFRVLAVGTGTILLFAVFLSLSKRVMIEAMGVIWSFFGVILILLGAVPALTAWSRTVPSEGAGVLAFLGECLIWALFAMSRIISQLIMKNQELAMQVSLLNQENEKILRQVELVQENRK